MPAYATAMDATRGPAVHLRVVRVSSCCRQRGFTLFEVILVLVILLVLGAVAVSSMDSTFAHYKVTAAADMVRGAWAEAQSHAINEGRPYRFAIVPNKGNFRVAPDGAGFWAGGSGTAQQDDPSNPAFVREGALPKGVRFSINSAQPADSFDQGGDSSAPLESTDISQWSTVATFLPNGSAVEDLVEISFGARAAKSIVLRLRGITGVVTMKSPESGGNRP
jgi:prepilin-type N-terminal cleavage/methylation domain-containing protein